MEKKQSNLEVYYVKGYTDEQLSEHLSVCLHAEITVKNDPNYHRYGDCMIVWFPSELYHDVREVLDTLNIEHE